MPVSRVFARAENNGTYINPQTLEAAREHWTQVVEETREKLKAYGDINWNSAKQVADVLFKKLKLPILG